MGLKEEFDKQNFANEKEEADWWYANRELVSDEFIKAAREGRLRRGSVLARLEGREPECIPPMNI